MNQNSEAAFPDEWPAGCPPISAANCDGSYFHLLGENPPGTGDLRSFAEKGRKLKNVPPCPCMPYGLSVFTDRDDAFFMHRAMPRLGKFIALLQFKSSDGKVMLTPGQRPSHNTWWPSSDCVRSECIVRIESVLS
jgi:hypothetical protein